MFSKKSFRNQNRTENQLFREIRNQLGFPLGKHRKTRHSGRILVYGTGSVPACVIETPILYAFDRAGYDPVILTSRSRVLKKTYRLFGFEKFLCSTDYEPPIDQNTVSEYLRDATSLQDLLSLRQGEVQVGKYAASSLLRRKRLPTVNLNDPNDHRMAREAVTASLASAGGARHLLAAYQPKAVLMIDRGYTPFGEMFDICIAEGIPVFTWNVSHRPNRVVMKRFHPANAMYHFASLAEPTWQALREMEWTEEHWRLLREEFVDSYTSGDWFAEVGTQTGVSTFDREQIFDKLALDPDKPTAVIFPHIFWDGTFFYGHDIFRDYEEWFCACLEIAAEKPELNWIIKVHPANRVKDFRDGVFDEHLEVKAVKRTLGELPSHIKLLEADTEISTLSLLHIADFCLTVRGTVGIEAACWGVRVLTAGTGRYDGYGFTKDFSDKESYLAALRTLETLPHPSEEEVELARRYGYGVFCLRAVPLKSVDVRFHRDSVASLETRLNCGDGGGLAEAPDIKAISEWIVSKEEDLCSWPEEA